MKVTKPRVSILDSDFRYIPAANTNVAKTFERERQRLLREKNLRVDEVSRALTKKVIRFP